MNMFVLNTQQSYFSFLLLVYVTLFSYSVQSVRFDLPYGKAARCFSEEINKVNSMVVGNYSIVNPNKDQPLPPTNTITVQVSAPQGNIPYHLAERVQAGQFAFTAYQIGQYVTCFVDTSDDGKGTLSVDFEWRTGVAARGQHNFAKKSDIDWLVFEVQIMHETALAIMEEMSYLHQRNTEMTELNWVTDNRIFLLNFVSIFVCLSVGVLQLWYLKTFFQKNKVI